MALTLTASETGLALVDKARKKKGYNKTNAVNWLEAAAVSRSTLDKFWARQPIKHENFVSICTAVGVEWQTVVDRSGNEASLQIESEANNTDKFKGLKIAKQIHDWLVAVEYKLKESYEVLEVDYCEWIIKIQDPVRRARFNHILIRGISSEARLPELQALERSRKEQGADGGWLIVNRRISPAVKIELEKDESQHLSCMTLDDLIDRDADFEPYLKWLEEEVIKRGIDRKYVSLACDKEEIDPVTQHSIATSRYGETEGWIEGYIKQWLSDDSKEHVSILGEFGTGKTWFSFHYAWECLQAYKLAKVQGGERPRLPLVIALRDYNKALKVESLVSDLFFNKHKIRLNSSVFDCLNQMGKLLIIFDGFDEMTYKIDRQNMIDNFWELARVVRPGSKVILTCRIEHFPHDRESRQLLNAKLESSTAKIQWEAPRFESLELVKFNESQIRQILTLEAEDKHLSTDIVQQVMEQPKLLDLASRPVMTELIIEAMPKIKAGETVNMSLIYYHAIVRKMDRDIKAERTFTSLADKLYFLCEIAWEMLSTGQMKLNYREFPDQIRKIFKESVPEEKDIDYWKHDMMGQTILIRNAYGDYTPAHKSFLEFLVAYKFAAELGLLKADFIVAAQQQTTDFIDVDSTPQFYTWTGYLDACVKAKSDEKKIAPLKGFIAESSDKLIHTFGIEPLTKAVIELILPMLELPNSKEVVGNPLLKLIHDTKGKIEVETGYLGGNAATLSVKQNPGALSFENFSYAQMANSDLVDADLQRVNFTGTNLANSLLKIVLPSAVLSIAISQDGQFFVTGHDDHLVRLWNARTGQLIYSCSGHQDSVRSVAISGDCNWFVSGSRDQTIKRWDFVTGICLETYNGHNASIRSIVINSKCNWIVSASDDATLRLWSITTDKCLRIYKGHDHPVRATASPPDSWSVKEHPIRAVAISPDSSWLVSGSVGKTLKRWDTRTGKCLQTYAGHANWVYTVAISADGSWLISGSVDKTLKRWDTKTGKCLQTYTGHADWIWAVAIAPDNSWFISASQDKTLKRWDIETAECLQTYTGHTDWVWTVAIAPDSSWLVSGSRDNTLKHWETFTGKCFQTYAEHQNLVSAVAICPDGSWSVSAGHDNTLKRWDTRRGKCLNTYTEHQDLISAIAISPNGAWFISASHDRTLKRWDTYTGICLQTYIGHEDSISAIAEIAPDGAWFISASHDKTLKRWDTYTGKCLYSGAGHQDLASTVIAIAPDGSWFINENDKNTFKRLDADKNILKIYRGHTDLVCAIAISSDGSWLISGSSDQTLKRWDIKTGKCLHTYTGHRESVKAVESKSVAIESVAISLESRYIISCARDEIKIWNVETGKCIRTILNKSCAGMQIRDAKGLSSGQIESLKALGAVDD